MKIKLLLSLFTLLVVILIVKNSIHPNPNNSADKIIPTPTPIPIWKTIIQSDFTVKRLGTENKLSDRNTMVITITSSADFTGKITDTFPQNVTVVWQGPAKISDQQITWKARLKKQIPQEFKYEYTGKSPFKFGPILINHQIFENYVEII